jgi:hypothetical protein
MAGLYQVSRHQVGLRTVVEPLRTQVVGGCHRLAPLMLRGCAAATGLSPCRESAGRTRGYLSSWNGYAGEVIALAHSDQFARNKEGRP